MNKNICKKPTYPRPPIPGTKNNNFSMKESAGKKFESFLKINKAIEKATEKTEVCKDTIITILNIIWEEMK